MVPLGSIKSVWKSLCLFFLESFLVLSLPAERNSSFCLRILASSLLVPAGSGKCTSKWNWTITRTKRGGGGNKIKRVTEGSYVVLCVFLLRWVLILPTVPPVRKFMPVGTPAEFKVTHMNNWLQGLGHSLQFLFQDKFIIIRSHLAPNIAGLGTSRSNGYLIFLLQEEQATGNLKQWFNNNNEKKKSLSLFCWGRFLSEWWALNSLFNKSSSPRGRRWAQKSFTFYKCLSGIIHGIIHYPGMCFRALPLHLLPYNFLEVIHVQIYIQGNQCNIEKLSNNWSGF